LATIGAVNVMGMAMDIIGGLSALSKAIDIAKALKDLESQFQSADFRLQTH
jgi:hypothetical protein